MPITSRGFARVSLALLVVGLVSLLAIVGTTIWLVERTQSQFEAVVEAREVRRGAVELRNLLLVAQTGQRGYLLTLDPRYLEPYESAIDDVLPAYEALRGLVRTLTWANSLPALRQTIEAKLAELAQTVALASGGDVAGALAVVATDVGQEMMDEIQSSLDALIEEADEVSFLRVLDQREAAAALRAVALIGAVIIILVVGGSVLTVMRYTRDLNLAHAQLGVLNLDLEGRVAERTRDLQRANDEVQRFAYVVTHDLRAPLVNIMGFTSELEASLEPIAALVGDKPDPGGESPEAAAARQAATEDLPEAIGFIRSSTRKMDALINAILKIAREGKRQLRPERIDLSEAFETMAAAIAHQLAEKDGEIAFDIRTPPVMTDRLSLEQIFGNLLDNAVKYRDPSRPLRIALRAHQERSGLVHVEVEDNGRGIPAEDHERVFELFRRSGTQDQVGEGIGLSHVRIMVRNLGGDITLRSEPGRGTVFTVTLAPDLRALPRS